MVLWNMIVVCNVHHRRWRKTSLAVQFLYLRLLFTVKQLLLLVSLEIVSTATELLGWLVEILVAVIFIIQILILN